MRLPASFNQLVETRRGSVTGCSSASRRLCSQIDSNKREIFLSGHQPQASRQVFDEVDEQASREFSVFSTFLCVASTSMRSPRHGVMCSVPTERS